MSEFVRPLGDRILCRVLTPSDNKKGSLYIPDNAKERPTKALVLAVGEGRVNEDGKRITMDVRVGETVLFGKYSGTFIEHEDEELLILREIDILAVTT